MKKIFLFATALLMSASMFAKTSVITYTAEEKLQEATGMYDAGLHLNAFYAADSTQLTVTHTFDEAESVGTITLDGEVAIIGERAFYHTGLTSVTIPEGVTTMGEASFFHCGSLSSITLPEGLITIGGSAFDDCESLQSINLPNTLTTIGEYAFIESGLTSITIPGGVTTIEENVFKSCPDLQSVILSEGITTIKMNAFAASAALTSVTLPTSLTTIGEQAFVMTGLTSIIIPASVTELGAAAFGLCASLASVTFESNACQEDIGEIAFYEVGKETPALLTLPDNWTGSKPDEDGNWYGGKFELAEDPSALPQMRAAVKATKVMTNGQVIFRAENKSFSVLGQEVR